MSTMTLRWRCLECGATRPTTPRDGGDPKDVMWRSYAGGFTHKCKTEPNDAVLELNMPAVVQAVLDAPLQPIIDNVNLGSLGISNRAIRALENSNVTMLRDLTTWTEAELQKVKGVGPGALAHIRRAMAQYGMELAT